MRGFRPVVPAALVLMLVFALAACGDDDPGAAADTSSGSDAGSAGGPESGSASGPESYGEFSPVSDVDPHAAIGQDIAEIKELIDVAEDGGAVDWAAVLAVFEDGGNSIKSDGSVRTLAGLVEAPEVLVVVTDAIDGTGAAAGADDAVRRQVVDKGISALLRAKVLDELEAAADKLADDETDADSGAPHNVDEAWAFFTAEGNGPATTAEKRAADFGLDGEVREAVEAALSDAQAAALDGDTAAFAEAAEEVQGALNFVYYLATYKYLETDGDPVTAAEGRTFFLAIAETVAGADEEAANAVTAAFDSGDFEAGREALNRPGVAEALGLGLDQVIDAS